MKINNITDVQLTLEELATNILTCEISAGCANYQEVIARQAMKNSVLDIVEAARLDIEKLMYQPMSPESVPTDDPTIYASLGEE